MSCQMKDRIIIMILLILAVLFISCTALAEGQTNPRRKHVEETLQWEEKEQIPGLFRSGGQTLTVTCDKTPTLAAPGKFTVTVNNDDGSEWELEYGVQDTDRDSGGYVYFSKATSDRTFEGFEIFTPGHYRLHVYLYKKGYGTRVARTSYDFTVEAQPGYPTLEEKAQDIVDDCCVAGNAWQTALNLHDWLTKHTYYDLNYEYYGADVLFRGKGVCDAYSKAFKLLCETAGITAERVTSRSQNHAWNVIQFGSTWYQVDVTWDDPSGGTAAVSGKEHYAYYCLSDEVMFLDHTRDDVSYDPGCPSMTMNYYIKKKSWQQFGNYSSAGNTVKEDFLNQLEQGYANLSFSLNDWYYYWPGGNTGYGMNAVRYGIYAAGMQQTNWTLAKGGSLTVEIALNYEDRVVTLKVTGWKDVTETGTLTLPASIKTIDANAFESTEATTAVIPKGCGTIGAEAFKNSGVRTVYIPSTVKTVDDSAFDGCGRIIFILDTAGSDFAEYARQKGHLAVEP